jgi:hypothetical protein
MFDHIISLGEDCFPRLFIDKYHLRKKFPTRMPFDGSIHSFNTVCDLIDNDFENYSNDIEYLKYNSSHGFCFKHKKYNILWNHERTDDILSLKYQLGKRSSQFKDILNSGSTVLFIIHVRNSNFSLQKINLIIKKKYPKLNYKILALSIFNKGKFKEKVEDELVYLNMQFITVKENINEAFIQERFKTAYGKSFTNDMLKEVCEVLEEDSNKYKLDEEFDFIKSIIME